MTLSNRNGKPFLYKTVRRGDRVVSRYVGPLHEALTSIIHQHDSLSSEGGKQAAVRRRKLQQQLEGIANMQDICRLRLGRAIDGWPGFPIDHSPELQDNDRFLLQDLAQRASAGSKAAIRDLNQWFSLHPGSVDSVGLLNAFVIDSVARALTGRDAAAKAVLTSAVQTHREYLLSLSDSPLARITADLVISSLLSVHLCLAHAAAGAYVKTPTKGDEAIATAQRQMLDAITFFDRLVEKSAQLSSSHIEDARFQDFRN